MKTKSYPLEKIAKKNYYRYGVAVNEDRSVPCEIDGMKPVSRRALWSTYIQKAWSNSSPIKSARVVGFVMGSYHPHGDKSIYDACVTLVNSPIKLIDGEGNWGSVSDESVAPMRYTNLRMSKFSEKVFFDKFYLPVVTLVNNYDGKEEEPLVLPALLPNLLLNGNFGIGVGVSTTIPSFTLDSLVKVIKKVIISNTPCTPKMCMGLEFTTLHEAAYKISENDLLEFYTTGKGRVVYSSVYTLDSKEKQLVITKFAPIPSLSLAITKALAMEDVLAANDTSGIEDKHGTVLIKLRKNIDNVSLKSVAENIIAKAFSSAVSYNINITKRAVIKETREASAELHPGTVPSIINSWIEFRIKLEKDACTYWIDKITKEIEHLDLMRLAVKHREFIIKALDKKVDEQALAEYIAQGLKITVEQANEILDLKVRRLRAMEDASLLKQIKEKKEHRATLDGRRKNPNEYIVKHIDEIVKAVAT